jgi:glutamate-1-semialdehyde 2,1-aminomutase
VGPLLGLFFAEAPVLDYDGAQASAGSGLYRRFFRALLDRGVALAPGPYEALFPSLAHGRDDIERTADLAAAAAREVAAST